MAVVPLVDSFDFHLATASLVEPMERLSHKRLPLVHEDMEEYMRDVHDHLLKVVQDVHRFRELLNNAMDLYLSTTSARLNSTVRQLTIVASLFLPLTFLTRFF